MYWRKAIFLLICSGFSVLFGFGPTAIAQEASGPTRKLAPGILTVIPNQASEEETFKGPMPLAEIVQDIKGLNWTPNFTAKSDTLLEKANRITLRHEVWALEFAFKPVRMMYIDIPQPTGKMHRKLIWYMVYRVKNTGSHLSAVVEDDDSGLPIPKVAPSPNANIRFFPHFVMEGVYFNPMLDRYEKKAYLDRLIPAAIGPIQKRERIAGTLHDSVSMMRNPIPLSEGRIDRSVWGVVTWEDLNPRIDYFSIYVQGLTNAYRFRDLPDGKRFFQHKTLQLNFWRPGDTKDQNEGEIRYGVRLVKDPVDQTKIFKLYGIDEHLDYRWLYR